MPYAHITGWGTSVPDLIMTNDDLSKIVDTNDAWIRSRTGIGERRIASKEDTVTSLAVAASIKALQVANLAPTELDLIICSTSSPEYLFPATACLIQDQIGANNAGAFDLLAACSGFIYGLNMASQAIQTGSIRSALVIGAEVLSRLVDWNDRGTCILFGDGAGAFVLQASPEPGGVLSAVMHSDGSGGDLLSLPGGGSHTPANEETVKRGLHFIHMDGAEVFRFATRVMAQATREVLEKAKLPVEDVKWIVPHQANLRIIDAAARGLKLPLDRFIINLERYGNTSTASIPLAMVEAVEKGQIEPGDKLVMVGFGAGLTWGALAAQWTGPLPTEKKVHPERFKTRARVRSILRRLWRVIEGLIWGRDG